MAVSTAQAGKPAAAAKAQTGPAGLTLPCRYGIVPLP